VCTFCTYMTQIYIYVVWYLTFYIACFFSVDMRQWCMSVSCSSMVHVNDMQQWCMSMTCTIELHVNEMQQWWVHVHPPLLHVNVMQLNGVCQCHAAMVGCMSMHPCCMSMPYSNGVCQWHTAMVHVNDMQQWCMSMPCSNGACQCHTAMVYVNDMQQWCMSMPYTIELHVNVMQLNGACQCCQLTMQMWNKINEPIIYLYMRWD